MKVRVPLTIDIDTAAWQLSYGDKPTREDVQAYVLNLVTEQLVQGVEVATDVRISS